MKGSRDVLLLYGVGLVAAWGGLGLVYAARPDGTPRGLLLACLALLGFPLVHGVLAALGFRGDGLALPVVMGLSGVGLMEIFRLQPTGLARQAGWIALGLAVMVLTYRLAHDPERLGRYRYLWAAGAVALLASALLFGVERGGARQWIDLGVVSFQPSEVVKVLLVLFLSAYLSEHQPVLTPHLPHDVELRALAPLGAVLGLSLLMLVIQRDLGGALLYFVIVLVMVYVGTGRVDYVAAGAASFLLGGSICYALFPHVRVRLDAWLDPWRDLPGYGYQTAQALFALASGGIVGTGLGFGHPDLVPAAHTDLILAAIGEELGYVGVVCVVVLYTLLVAWGFRVALRVQATFSRLVAAGASTVLGVQTVLILGGSLRFVPLTGITLPFVSYGGSSVVSNFVLLGLLLAISHRGETAREVNRGRAHP